MKKIVLFLSLIYSFSSFSNVISGEELEAQNADLSSAEVFTSPEELSTVKIKEIKDYLASVDANSTCLDEMLQRRKQLILKLSFAPVVGPIAVVGSSIGLGIVGGVVGAANNPPGGFGDLAGVVTGMFFGGLFSAVTFGVDTTKSIISVVRLNNMIKVLGEQYLNRSGKKSEKFYQYYLKKSSTDELDKEAFLAKLLDHDRDGSLCDGTMVKKPWLFKKYRSKKLKYKVANTKDFVKYLNSNN
jgi:hypothetical protein